MIDASHPVPPLSAWKRFSVTTSNARHDCSCSLPSMCRLHPQPWRRCEQARWCDKNRQDQNNHIASKLRPIVYIQLERTSLLVVWTILNIYNLDLQNKYPRSAATSYVERASWEHALQRMAAMAVKEESLYDCARSIRLQSKTNVISVDIMPLRISSCRTRESITGLR